jgi:hypothetical protein
MSEAKIEFTTSKSGTDKSCASSVPIPAHGLPAPEAVQKDTPSRDAWLINLCDEFLAIDEEHTRLRKAAEGGARERFCGRTAARSRELLSAIFGGHAKPLGLAAKAKIASKLVSRDVGGQPDERDRPLDSLATDILALAAKDQGPDGELLAAAVDFHRMRAEDKAFWEVTKDDPGNKHADAFNQPDGLWVRISGAVQRVSNFAATTPEGLVAKASVLEEIIRQEHRAQLEADCEDEEIMVALSLLRDVLGRA